MQHKARPPYWFKPARFRAWFVAYYPVTWQGWAVTFVLGMFAVYASDKVGSASHSASDTLIGLALPYIATGVVFDLACRFRGEYPWWWRQPPQRQP